MAVQELDVLFAIDRAGVVGPDGATHAGNLDLSFLRCVPHMVVMAPADEAECRQMLTTGLRYPGPAAVRYPRGSGTGVAAGTDLSTLEIGKADLRVQGTRVALLAFGSTVPAAEAVGRELGLSVVNMRFIKPLDRTLLLELARTHDGFVTIEDNVVAGGAGSGVAELFSAEDVLRSMLHLGLPDSFQHHASREDLLAEAGIDAAGIRAAVLKRWPQLASDGHPLSAAG
ncbi:1-deoxy-D-xylulose-5-phosphate synthase [compost metagenome]